MGINGSLLLGIDLASFLTNGALIEGYAVVASTDNAGGEQRVAPAAAISQHATFSSIEVFVGIADRAAATATMGAVQIYGRRSAVGGGVITAGDYVIWQASGKFTTHSLDAAKFAYIAGYAATDCAGDGSPFDLMIAPRIIGPASGSSVNLTLSGTLTAADVTTTDDVTVGDDLVVTGLATIGETLGVTGASTFAAASFSGNLTASARVLHKQGADVASATNLVLGSDGNVFEITGTTKIDLISNLTWQNGAEVTLYFTSTANVDHGTATSTTNITILLDGAVDFVPAAGDMLKLTLCEIGGTQAWRESGRMTVA